MSVDRTVLHSKVADFIDIVNFERHCQNKVGNIGINSNFIMPYICKKCSRWDRFQLLSVADPKRAHPLVKFLSFSCNFLQKFCQIVGWLTLLLWGMLVSVNSGFFSPSRFSHFHCNAVRKAIKVAENLHTNQQNEHTPETFKMQKGPIYIN